MFKHLHEDEIEKIAKEVAALGPVASETGERVLEEFHQLTQAANYVTRGGVDYARRLLQRSFGKEDASRILDRVVRSFKTTAGFATLEKTDPQQLSKFILAEHPQTIALDSRAPERRQRRPARVAAARRAAGGRARRGWPTWTRSRRRSSRGSPPSSSSG